MSASSLKLDNLIAIVDDNGFQNEIEPSEKIWTRLILEISGIALVGMFVQLMGQNIRYK